MSNMSDGRWKTIGVGVASQGLMGLRHMVTGLVLVLGLALAGCASSPSNTVVVDGQGGTQGITVRSSSEVKVVPDLASFNATVTTTGSKADTVKKEHDQQVDAVIEALKKAGVATESVQTTTTWLNPSYTYDDTTGQQQLTGYEAYTSLEISDAALDDVATLMRTAIDAGATGVDGLSYYASTYDEAYEEALTSAIEASLPKAQAIAKAGGVKLGTVLGVDEGYQDTSLRYAAATNEEMALDAADAGAGKIEPGQVSVEATVTVRYAID